MKISLLSLFLFVSPLSHGFFEDFEDSKSHPRQKQASKWSIRKLAGFFYNFSDSSHLHSISKEYNQVMKALKSGADAEELKNLGLNLNAKSPSGETPLQWSIRNYKWSLGDTKENYIKTLVAAGADLNTQNRSGLTPASQAVTVRLDIELIEILISKNGDNLNIPNTLGNTALHQAIKIKYLEVLPLLIEKGASTDIKNNEDLYPLDMAMNINLNPLDIEVLKTLVPKDEKSLSLRNKRGNLIFTKALHKRYKDEDFLRRLVPKDKATLNSLDAKGYSPLHIAIHTKNHVAIRILLELGADINLKTHDGETPESLMQSRRDQVALDIFEG